MKALSADAEPRSWTHTSLERGLERLRRVELAGDRPRGRACPVMVARSWRRISSKLEARRPISSLAMRGTGTSYSSRASAATARSSRRSGRCRSVWTTRTMQNMATTMRPRRMHDRLPQGAHLGHRCAHQDGEAAAERLRVRARLATADVDHLRAGARAEHGGDRAVDGAALADRLVEDAAAGRHDPVVAHHRDAGRVGRRRDGAVERAQEGGVDRPRDEDVLDGRRQRPRRPATASRRARRRRSGPSRERRRTASSSALPLGQGRAAADRGRGQRARWRRRRRTRVFTCE